VFLNLSSGLRHCELEGYGSVDGVLASTLSPRPFDGTLLPDEGVVLRLAPVR
jgi:hypothetical protein